MAVDFFLKIEGPDVEGEAMDSAHEGEISVASWAWGMSQSGTMHVAKGGGAGKVAVQDLTINKQVDKSTPNLMQHCCMGTQFETATLVCRKAAGDGGQLEYITLVMKHVIITSVQPGGSAGGDDLFESVSLNFGEFTITYVPQDNDGSALPEVGPVGWNMQTNEAV
ncbi:MAG TPA: type VI secretion system tube protein Hcp [Geminicoccaceae bacterium]|nr:type VI secretion system tube protein Hcp [Geminicoccaceae bacterium]